MKIKWCTFVGASMCICIFTLSNKLKETKMKDLKITEAAKKRMYSTMGTAKMECELALNLEPQEVNIFQMKNKKGEIVEGVYYLVGSERNEKGLPTKIHFKKDFR